MGSYDLGARALDAEARLYGVERAIFSPVGASGKIQFAWGI
jgi:hypothetical protein